MDVVNLVHFFLTIKRAVARAMERVRSEQTLQAHHRSKEVGDDATLLTRVDAVSEEVLVERLSVLPSTTIVTKNGARSTGKYIILINPCNGSLPLSQGLFTSTISVGLLDDTGMLVAVVVGEPISGRMWCASRDSTTTVQTLNYPLRIHQDGSGFPELASERDVHVWQPKGSSPCLSRRTTVFVDRTHGKTRAGCDILSDLDVASMLSRLIVWSGLMITGSAIQNMALVANGESGVAGSIMTALGGGWDACCSLLVTRAGGCVRAFKMIHDEGRGVNPLLMMSGTRHLAEVDPLRPIDRTHPLRVPNYDILVAGNSAHTVETLIMCVTGARTPNI